MSPNTRTTFNFKNVLHTPPSPLPLGGTPYNDLFGKASLERVRYLFRLQVYRRVGISQVEICKGREIGLLGIQKGF